jgi:hypothetical protein
VIRVEPPLVITYEEIDTILNRLEDTLQELYSSVSVPAIPLIKDQSRMTTATVSTAVA